METFIVVRKQKKGLQFSVDDFYYIEYVSHDKTKAEYIAAMLRGKYYPRNKDLRRNTDISIITANIDEEKSILIGNTEYTE